MLIKCIVFPSTVFHNVLLLSQGKLYYGSLRCFSFIDDGAIIFESTGTCFFFRRMPFCRSAAVQYISAPVSRFGPAHVSRENPRNSRSAAEGLVLYWRPGFKVDLHDTGVTTAPADNASRGCVMREVKEGSPTVPPPPSTRKLTIASIVRINLFRLKQYSRRTPLVCSFQSINQSVHPFVNYESFHYLV